MLKPANKISTSPRKSSSSPKTLKNGYNRNDKSLTKVSSLNGRTPRNVIEGERRVLKRRAVSCSTILAPTLAKGNCEKKQSVDLETSDFQMLKISHEDSDEDELAMTSLDSRSFVDTDSALMFEGSFNDNEEYLTLQDICDIRSEDSYSKLETFESQKLEESETDSMLPRLQRIQLDEEEQEKTEKEMFGSDTLDEIQFLESGKQRESSKQTETKLKAAWELDERFSLSTDFPAEVWNERKRNSAISTRESSDLLNQSFPPLSLSHGMRRGSFPLASAAFTEAKRGLPSLSGKQCKVQLPVNFPGVPSISCESVGKSSNEELKDHIFMEKAEALSPRDNSYKSSTSPRRSPVPVRQSKSVAFSSPRATPTITTSQFPQMSPERLAMQCASTEYLAARMVTQLDCAFTETVTQEDLSRPSCVTPNLMPRRYSSLCSRPNTTSNNLNEDNDSLILPSLYNECSKSLPNLRESKSKRVFVTFDKDFPLVNVVNLQGKSDLAQKCRLIDNKLDSEDAVLTRMVEKKVKKKDMVKKWVNSCT